MIGMWAKRESPAQFNQRMERSHAKWARAEREALSQATRLWMALGGPHGTAGLYALRNLIENGVNHSNVEYTIRKLNRRD